LYETIITCDDTCDTFDFGDCYAILPSLKFWGNASPKLSDARVVNEGVKYSSDANKEWLSPEALVEVFR
jgi:hypothetical protein